MQLAHSAIAASAYQLATALQRRMVEAQEGLAGGERFSETTWLRDDGRRAIRTRRRCTNGLPR